MKVIDCHSHISLGYDDNGATIEEYAEVMDKYSIVCGLIMPQPILKKNILVSSKLFDEINKLCYDTVNKFGDERIKFVPIISPTYTSISTLKKYKKDYNPIAYKIHFKSDKSYPNIINNDWIEEIRSQDIPIIVHTDYSKNNNIEKDKLKNLNSAINWFDFFEKNKIKGYLTHGARLNKEVFLKIKNSNYVVIGIGPDSLLNDKQYNLLEQNGDYLKILHNNVSSNKLIFDVDFKWNVFENKMDINAIERVKSLWQGDDLNKILYQNAVNFFKLNVGEK